MKNKFLEVTQEAGADLFKRNIQGEIVMLNLLRFRQIADYSANPELAQTEKISGVEAFQRYIDHTLPLLRKTGGDITFLGEGGHFLTGPQIRSGTSHFFRR